MGKINFSTMENVTEVIPKEDIEIINQGTHGVASSSNGEIAESVTNAISPTAAISSVINHALESIDNIAQCIAYVSAEKQKTRRVEVQAEVCIEEAIQNTKQIRIQEEEKTRRVIQKCQTSLKVAETELKKLSRENSLEMKKLTKGHKEFMSQLDMLRKCIDSIIDSKTALFKYFREDMKNDISTNDFFDKLNEVDNKLIEISKQVVELKKGHK